MNALTTNFDTDAKTVRLAREIAMDLHPIEKILERCGVSAFEWDQLQRLPRFQVLLQAQVEAWESAINTAERVKLKSMAFIEESLPEFFTRAHDPQEVLSSKVEILKTVAKFGGIGGTDGVLANSGAKFSIVIDMGSDRVALEGQLPAPVTIDGSETIPPKE